MRVPQWPQKGSPVSAGLLHLGQREGTAAAACAGDEGREATGVGAGVAGERGTAVRAAVADPAPEPPIAAGAAASDPESTVPPRPPAPTCAAEAVIGFPQSMQNREVASFSRPQKVQAVNRQPPKRENHMGREYRNAYRGGQPKERDGQRRESPKGAKFQTAQNSERRRIP